MTERSEIIGVIGLGYVGFPLAVAFAKVRNVVGYDLDSQRVSELNEGVDMTKEVETVDFADLATLSISSDPNNLRDVDIFIITVPTPVDEIKQPDFSYLIAASKLVGSYIKPGNLVIFESTVFPGATEEVCVPQLCAASGLPYLTDHNDDGRAGFYVGYSPERINPGDRSRSVKDIVKVVSGSSRKAANRVQELYEDIVNETFMASSIVVAEAAKVIENAQRDLNIAFVNELSLLFDKLGIQTYEVLAAARTKWNFLDFEPGLVGGHCIGVDPYYLMSKAKEIGFDTRVLLAGRETNDNMAIYMANKLQLSLKNNHCPINDARIGVLGVTFKENCPDTRNSKAFEFIETLKSFGHQVKSWDPYVEVGLCGTCRLEEFQQLDALVVCVPHDSLIPLTTELVGNCFKPAGARIVFDMKSRISRDSLLSNECFVLSM